MKNTLLTGKTNTGKTYTFFKEHSQEKFIALFPCRQLCYEAFMKYGNKETDQLINGEVQYTPENFKNTFAVYENASIDNIKKYDVIFIDEFHYLSDFDRGQHLLNIIEKANNLGIEIIGATATNNLEDSELAKMEFSERELFPFSDPPVKKEILNSEFIQNASNGMSSIVFVRYTPGEFERQEWIERTGLKDEEVAIISASTLPSKRLQNQIDFESGKIKLILSTNVLAQGLNFPAQQVMIHYNPYDGAEVIIQKLGRLGRHGYGLNEVYYTSVEDVKIYKQKIIKKTTVDETNYIPFIDKNIDKKFPTHMTKFYDLYNYNSFKYSKSVLEYLFKNKSKYLSKNETIQVSNALNMLHNEEVKIKQILQII